MEELLLSQQGPLLYAMLFFLLLGGAVGLPIPEDLPLILGGVLIQIGRADWLWTILVMYCGVLIGDIFIFSVGRTLGPRLFRKQWFRSRFSPQQVRKLRFKLERRSFFMVLIARHLFYLRTVTFLTCGAVRMSFTKFIVADALAAFISVPVMTALGYVAAQNYHQLLVYFGEAKIVSLLLLVLAIGALCFWYKKQQKISPHSSCPDRNLP